MILNGKRILVTRPRARATEFANALIQEGAIPVVFPVTQILPLEDYSKLDSALLNLAQYDWLVLTSIYGVEAFVSRTADLGIKQLPSHLRVASIGRKTMSTLARHGILTNFVPSEFSSRALADAIAPVEGKRFLLLQSNLADSELQDSIQSQWGHVTDITAYRNIPARFHDSDAEVLNSWLDIITFCSPSAVKGLVQAGRDLGVNLSSLPGNPLIACIGPVTARTAREAGLSVPIEAKEHTSNGLITVLKNYQQEQICKHDLQPN